MQGVSNTPVAVGSRRFFCYGQKSERPQQTVHKKAISDVRAPRKRKCFRKVTKISKKNYQINTYYWSLINKL